MKTPQGSLNTPHICPNRFSLELLNLPPRPVWRVICQCLERNYRVQCSFDIRDLHPLPILSAAAAAARFHVLGHQSHLRPLAHEQSPHVQGVLSRRGVTPLKYKVNRDDLLVRTT